MFKFKRGRFCAVGELEKYQVGSSEVFFYFKNGIEMVVGNVPENIGMMLRTLNLSNMRNALVVIPLPGMKSDAQIKMNNDDSKLDNIEDGETTLVFHDLEVKGRLKYFNGGTQTSYFPFFAEIEISYPNMPEDMLHSVKSIRLDTLKNSKIDFTQKRVFV